MASQIQLRRDTGSNWASVNPTLAQGEIGINTTTGQFKIGDGSTAWNSLSYSAANISLNDLGDVTITSAANGDFLRWNGTAWVNDAVNLSTDTVGDYVNTVTASTGVTITGAGGESSSPVFSIGQPVGINDEVTFARVNIGGGGSGGRKIAFEGATNNEYETTLDAQDPTADRTIYIPDADGTIALASASTGVIALGTDTTGNYVTDLVGDGEIIVSHTPGEGSTASISLANSIVLTGLGMNPDSGAPPKITFYSLTDQPGRLSWNATGIREVTIPDASGTVALTSSSTGIVALGTDTTGNYVNDVVSGTGVTVTHTPGEGSSASISIGQDVGTSASVQFGQVTTTGDVTVGGNLTVNGTTTTLNTETLAIEDNIVLLNSNVTGSPTTNAGIEVERGDASNVVLRWNESTDSWEVTEDGSTYKNIAVGQDVETTSSVSFAAVTASTFTGNLVGNADTASALQTARTIALSGDLSGSVSFDGSSSVTLNATVVNSGVSLDEISDVVITAPEEFQGLSYNGTNWVNSHIPLVSYVRNAEATTITTGTAVYLFGGTGDHASVKRADNGSDTTSSKTIGVAGANIPASNNGPIVTRGYVDGINLSTGYSVGDILWLGENGAFTTTKPISPDHLVFIGVVVRASVNGIIYVATQNGYETGELHDVRTNGKVDKDVLMWNASSSVWVNEQINLGTDTVGNYVADVVAGSSEIVISHTPGEGSSASISLGDDITLNNLTMYPPDGFAPSAAEPRIRFLSTTDQPGDLTWKATAYRVVSIPDTDGTLAIVSSSTGVVALGTDTTGNYVANVVQGTGILVTHTPGEGSSASIALNAGLNELSDASVVDPMEGQLLIRTADSWRNVSASGDVTVNASGVFSIAADSVALGTDTTGNYMTDVAGGTGVTVSHTPGEGSTASVSIGQNVGTSASVEFARITMTGAVTGDTTVATKAYVDNVASGIHYHLSANYATAAALPNGPTYSNGTNGVGATLTASASARLVVDGSNVSTGERVLVKNQADAKQNGIYECTEQGSVSVAWVLTRASDSNNSISGQVKTGDSLFVTGGTTNIRVGFTLTSTGSGGGGVHVLGTDDLTFTEFTGISVSTAGTGLVKDGNTLNVATANAGRIVVNADDIDLALVGQTNTTGTSGISFVQSHSVDSYGRITGTVTADVRDASTSQKGIAQFSSSHFSVSGGSVQIANGAITAEQIANGTITNSDISENASIGLLKLQSGTAGQIIVTDATGVPQYQTPSGDITVNASGAFTIAANSVALGTDTTGNYMTNIVGSGGILVTHTPGEGSTASISFDPVITSSNAGSDTTSFISSITVNSNGQVTAYNTSSVQDASATQKGIAQFNSNHFAVSSGSVSIASNAIALGTNTTGNYVADVAGGTGVTVTHTPGEGSTASIAIGQSVATTASPTFAAITTTGTASIGTNASVSSALFVAGGQIVANESASQSRISLRPLNAGVPYETLRLASQYSIGTFNTSAYIQGINFSGNVASGIQLTTSTSNSGFSPVVTIGPRILVSASYASDLSSSMTSDASSSVHLAVQRSNSSSAAFVLYDQVSGSSNMLEVRDSSNAVRISVGVSSNNYMLYAESASLTTASVGALNISNLTVGGPLTVSGDLTVNGTTTTINSTTLTVDDPIIVLGGDTAPISDDNKDRGVSFRYHSGLSASVGFFGYDDSTGRFTFLTGATNTSEVFNGTNASVQVGSLHIVGGPGAQDYIVANYDGSTASISLAATTDRMDLVNSSLFRGLHFVSTGGINSASISYSTATNTFSFSRAISSASLSSASLSSASIVAPYVSGSVQFDTSASVTLPSKTFFPEEYLSVSSSVTLNSTTHRYATLEMTASAGTSVITVPADASDNFPVGSVIQIIRVGAGEVQVTASAGVTVNNALGSRLRAQWSTATLRKRSSNTWLLSGDLKV